MNHFREVTNMVPPWWPICAVCNKVVDRIESVPDPMQSAVRHYIVTCHGQTEQTMVGIWAAFEIAQGRKRLPDAFKPKPNT